jgi:hypothetical protein
LIDTKDAILADLTQKWVDDHPQTIADVAAAKAALNNVAATILAR